MAKASTVANSVLRALSRKDYQHMLARSEKVTLTYGDVLSEPGDHIQYVYFPSTGLISLLTPLEGHLSVEVGMVGQEGMAGMSLVLGIDISPVRVLVQGSGSALRMKTAAFRRELKRNPVLQRELNQYLYVFMAQVVQTAACNRHHVLDERLARWLLMTHDRIQANQFLLTQEFLAHMLGVRRVGVSKAAMLLQKKHLISYTRSHISILDRKGLERASCRCYEAVNELRDGMFH